MGARSYTGDNQIHDFVDGLNQETMWAVRLRGKINIPTDGEYEFRIKSDDGSMLYIGGELAVENDGEHWVRTRTADVQLTAGEHTFVLALYNYEQDSTLEIQWTPTPGGSRATMTAADLLHDRFICPC
eukprot:COSAG02_NODE_25797_length_648_cov_37.347905_2_plen_127_part_01